VSEFANQYGINLGAIDEAVSAQKTAQQNQELNALQINKIKDDKVKEDASEKADKDYMNNPQAAVATSIKQKMNWATLDEVQRKNAADQLKETINKHGLAIHNIMQIQDPTQQKQALEQNFQQLSPAEQQEYSNKYGTTSEQWQQNLPNTMNDLLVANGGVDLLQRQEDAKVANQYKLNEDALKQKNSIDIENLKGGYTLSAADKKIEADKLTLKEKEKFTSGENELNRQNRTKNAQIKSKGSDRLTEGDKNVLALMDANPGITQNQARIYLLNAPKTTNVNDPIYGDKTITSSKTLPNGGNKPVQPSAYNPANVVRYGTKGGQKVAQMKDGSIVYVK
jgi:hypothetical protein